MQLRDAAEQDFATILALNEASVHFLSPLTAARLSWLHGQAAYHRVVEQDGAVCAFLLAFAPGTAYDSANYRWFTERYTEFLYVDRVVVDIGKQGRGLGRILYDDLFDFARARAFPRIVCEFDIEPPNESSRRFHERFGFREVGTQWLADRKRVSMQEAIPN